MATCTAGPCGMFGRAFVLVVLCCGAAGVHWWLRPFNPSEPAAPPTAPVAPSGPTGAGSPLPAVAAPAGSGTTFRSPDLPARSTLDQGMISLEEAKAMLAAGTAQWVDARTPEEFAQDRIGDALHIDPDAWLGGKIPEVIHAMSRDMPVVVYCGGGNCDASKLVATRLRGVGFSDVKVFEDGWKGWTAARLPTAAHPEGAPAGK